MQSCRLQFHFLLCLQHVTRKITQSCILRGKFSVPWQPDRRIWTKLTLIPHSDNSENKNKKIKKKNVKSAFLNGELNNICELQSGESLGAFWTKKESRFRMFRGEVSPCQQLFCIASLVPHPYGVNRTRDPSHPIGGASDWQIIDQQSIRELRHRRTLYQINIKKKLELHLGFKNTTSFYFQKNIIHKMGVWIVTSYLLKIY